MSEQSVYAHTDIQLYTVAIHSESTITLLTLYSEEKTKLILIYSSFSAYNYNLIDIKFKFKINLTTFVRI